MSFSMLRASLCGQWVPSCSSACSMQLLHMAASWSAPISQQWRTSTTASTSTAAAASPSGAPPVQPPQQQEQQPPTPAVAPGSKQHQQQQEQQRGRQQNLENPQQQEQEDPEWLRLQQQYQRSRLHDFYLHHLSREMMLKLNVRSAQQLPRLRNIDLSVSAKDLYGKRYVEKWEMLLPALALEYISGQPATFVYSSVKYYRSKNAVTAVNVRLAAADAYDFLQKLNYIVLPTQNGFAGVSSRAFDKAGNLHFMVPRMANFPDFEEQFEIFESLGSMHVSINIRNVVGAPERSRLILSGLQLPILHKVKGAPADEGDAAAEGSDDGDDDGDSETDESDSEADGK